MSTAKYIANQILSSIDFKSNCLPLDLHLRYISLSFKTRSEISRNHWFGSCFWRKQSSNDHLCHCVSFYGRNTPFDYVNLSTWLNYFNADGTRTKDFKSYIGLMLMLQFVISNNLYLDYYNGVEYFLIKTYFITIWY